MNILLFGPQGSGKGTQAAILAEKFGLNHIETGKIFRQISTEDNELGKKVKEFNEDKKLVPDEITLQILEFYLAKIPSTRGLVLDSAPRTQGQIEGVEKIFNDLKRDIDVALYLTLPYEDSVTRIAKRFVCQGCGKNFILGQHIQAEDKSCPECGGVISQRVDDSEEGVRKRLDDFYQKTIPVIEHYRKKGILIEVDGRGSIEQVTAEIIDKIENRHV